MAEEELAYGEEVVFPWGIEEIHGTVEEVYGTPPRRYVVVALTPERSGSMFPEATTVTMPIDSVKKVAPAA